MIFAQNKSNMLLESINTKKTEVSKFSSYFFHVVRNVCLGVRSVFGNCACGLAETLSSRLKEVIKVILSCLR